MPAATTSTTCSLSMRPPMRASSMKRWRLRASGASCGASTSARSLSRRAAARRYTAPMPPWLSLRSDLEVLREQLAGLEGAHAQSAER